MVNRSFITPVMSFAVDGFPTLTEIIRINHTITALKLSTEELTNKLARPIISNSKDELLQHALEIEWGWKDLDRFLLTITDSFFEKGSWKNECEKGQDKIIEILSRINSDEYINDI